MGFLVLLATVQLWNLLHHNLRLQVIGRTRQSLGRGGGLLAGHLDPAHRLCHCCKPSFPKAAALESHCFPRKHYTANHQFKLAMNFGKKKEYENWFLVGSSTLHQQYGLKSDICLLTSAHNVMWTPNKSIWTCYVTIEFEGPGIWMATRHFCFRPLWSCVGSSWSQEGKNWHQPY